MKELTTTVAYATKVKPNLHQPLHLSAMTCLYRMSVKTFVENKTFEAELFYLKTQEYTCEEAVEPTGLLSLCV